MTTQQNSRCPRCKGRGQVIVENYGKRSLRRCDCCHGSKLVKPETVRLYAEAPAFSARWSAARSAEFAERKARGESDINPNAPEFSAACAARLGVSPDEMWLRVKGYSLKKGVKN